MPQLAGTFQFPLFCFVLVSAFSVSFGREVILISAIERGLDTVTNCTTRQCYLNNQLAEWISFKGKDATKQIQKHLNPTYF